MFFFFASSALSKTAVPEILFVDKSQMPTFPYTYYRYPGFICARSDSIKEQKKDFNISDLFRKTDIACFSFKRLNHTLTFCPKSTSKINNIPFEAEGKVKEDKKNREVIEVKKSTQNCTIDMRENYKFEIRYRCDPKIAVAIQYVMKPTNCTYKGMILTSRLCDFVDYSKNEKYETYCTEDNKYTKEELDELFPMNT
jgi:hypothetical protein